MWKRLENLPRHEHTHAFLTQHFNGNAAFIDGCFDRTSEFSEAFPCPDGGANGCFRQIVKLPDGKLVAVCDDDHGCDDVEIQREDLRVYSLNTRKLAIRLAEALADANIVSDPEILDQHCNLARIGYFIPRGTLRFPVFLHLPIYGGDRDKAINKLLHADRSFILLLPTIDGIAPELQNLLAKKHSTVIAAEQISSPESIIDAAAALQSFQKFYEMQPDENPEITCEKFPTPPGAQWSDITIKFVDGHRVRVSCKRKAGGSESAVYNFTQMGMCDARAGEPNKQWGLLTAFAEERGNLTWDNSKATDRNKKRKQSLKETLQKFFGIHDTDPFEDYKDEKGHVCYRSKCHVFPEDDTAPMKQRQA